MLLVLAVACGDKGATGPEDSGGGGGGGGGSGVVASIQLSQTVATVTQGATVQLTATAVNANNQTVTATIVWASDNPAIATVNASGLVTGVTAGTTTIRATVGTVSASANLTVNIGAPTIASIDPMTANVNTAVAIRIIGTNFTSATVARLNGAQKPTTFVSATELRMSVAAADLPTATAYSVTVFTPPPGGGTSNALTLTAQQVISFTCPPQPMEIPATFTGNLTTNDCRLTDNTFFDLFSFTLTSAQQLTFNMTGQAGMDAFLFVLNSQDQIIGFNDDATSTSLDARMRILLPSGTYRVAANTAVANQVGTYILTASTFPTASASDCQEVWVMRGLQWVESINTNDCRTGTPAAFSDHYFVMLQTGQTLTVTMTSTVFDAFLRLYNVNTAQPTLVASDNNSGGGTNARLTFTAPSNMAVLIDAGTNGAGLTGAYTIVVTQ